MVNIRPARTSDVKAIRQLVDSYAAPGHMLSKETVTLYESVQEFTVAEVDGKIVGIALWFLNYSTWLGKPGVYLEDLFVQPEYRGHGIGKGFMKTLAQLCVERGYERFQWWVLDWNTPSIDFYKSLGAVAMDDWTVFRLYGDALKKFANQP